MEYVKKVWKIMKKIFYIIAVLFSISNAIAASPPILVDSTPEIKTEIIQNNSFIMTETGLKLADSIDEKKLPTYLLPWVDWLKIKNNQNNCLIDKENKKFCSFVYSLSISKTDNYYDIKLKGINYAQDYWLFLPSGEVKQSWPENILLNGNNAAIIEKDNKPLVKLDIGEFEISYQLNALQIDRTNNINMPYNILVIKNLTGKKTLFENAKLSILNDSVDKEQKSSESNQSQIKVYRLLNDGIPIELVTQIEITNPISQKNIFLGKVIPKNFKLTKINSSISVEEKIDGFYVNTPAGNHSISFTSYSMDNLSSINTKDLVNGIEQEIWSISKNPNIRQLEIEGVQSVDPSQVFLPKQWQALPSYKVVNDIKFVSKRRGLSLKDTINVGIKRNSWYGFNDNKMYHFDELNVSNDGKNVLSFEKSIDPKEFSINQEPQMLVDYANYPSVIIPNGDFSAQFQSQTGEEVSSKFIKDSQQQINSWNLILAPRHRLFHVSGVEKANNSWFENWNLYTVFALFLIILSFYKLFGIKLAVLSFISIVAFQSDLFLSWIFWPLFLLFLAFLKVLPDKNKFTYLIRTASVLLVISLFIVTVNFSINEIRYIINPSLEYQSNSFSIMNETNTVAEVSSMPAPSSIELDRSMSTENKQKNSSFSKLNQLNIERQKIQVSTGMPSWSGKNYSIDAGGNFKDSKFYIVPPFIVNVGAIIQIILIWVVLLFSIVYILISIKNKRLLENIEKSFVGKYVRGVI